MDPLSAAGAAGAAGYLLGSIPFAWIAVRWRTGKDLRREGSGNVGATNASRILGRGWFPVLFLLDAGKGASAVIVGQAIPMDASSGAACGAAEVLGVAGAAGAILGHLLPLWLGFRGGKAVATGAGAVAVLSPLAAGAGALAFLITAAVWKYVSLGSVLAALAASLAQVLLDAGHLCETTLLASPVTHLVVLLALVVIVKHIPNLRRIAAGTEPRIFERPAEAKKEDAGEG